MKMKNMKKMKNKPLHLRTDDEIRDRARELHEEDWVIEIHDDAEVVRGDEGDEEVRVLAWITLGRYD